MQLQAHEQHLGHDQAYRLEALTGKHVGHSDEAELHLPLAGHGSPKGDEEHRSYESAGGCFQASDKQRHHCHYRGEGLQARDMNFQMICLLLGLHT